MHCHDAGCNHKKLRNTVSRRGKGNRIVSLLVFFCDHRQMVNSEPGPFHWLHRIGPVGLAARFPLPQLPVVTNNEDLLYSSASV